MDPDEKPDFVLHTFIRCSRDALWDALRDPGAVPHYHFLAARAEQADGRTTLFFPDGREMMVMAQVDETPKSRLETTFEPRWEPDARVSRVVYRIEEEDGHCKLTVEHYALRHGAEGVADGWARWAAGLKTWLETGTQARFADPALAGA